MTARLEVGEVLMFKLVQEVFSDMMEIDSKLTIVTMEGGLCLVGLRLACLSSHLINQMLSECKDVTSFTIFLPDVRKVTMEHVVNILTTGYTDLDTMSINQIQKVRETAKMLQIDFTNLDHVEKSTMDIPIFSKATELVIKSEVNEFDLQIKTEQTEYFEFIEDSESLFKEDVKQEILDIKSEDLSNPTMSLAPTSQSSEDIFDLKPNSSKQAICQVCGKQFANENDRALHMSSKLSQELKETAEMLQIDFTNIDHVKNFPKARELVVRTGSLYKKDVIQEHPDVKPNEESRKTKDTKNLTMSLAPTSQSSEQIVDIKPKLADQVQKYIPPTLTREFGLKCHICGFLSRGKQSMKRHLVTHSSKLTTCQHCGKQFANKKGCELHESRLHRS